MTLRDKVGLAWSNLGRRKVRTALTSTGVVVGILTLVTMVSLVNGVQQQVKAQFERIGLDRVVVKPPGEGLFGGGGFGDGGGVSGFNPFDPGGRVSIISPKDVARWKKWPETVQVLPEIEIPASITTGFSMADGGNGLPTKTPASKKKRADDIVPVRVGSDSTPRRGPFSDPPKALAGTLDLPEGKGNIVVSEGVLDEFDVPPIRYRALIGTLARLVLAAPRGGRKSYNLRICGISSGQRREVQISTADRLDVKGWWFNEPDLLQKEGYDSVTIRAADVIGARQLVKRLRREHLSVQSIDAILDVANRIFGAITAMLGLVSSVALFVAFLGIANTMIMSIYERTREIGTLKAMGASKSDIRQMFMLEAGLIGLLGGVVGVGGSWLLGRGLDRFAHWYAIKRALPLPDQLFILTPSLALQALVFAFFIGIIAGVYPANRAARLNPLVALRHE